VSDKEFIPASLRIGKHRSLSDSSPPPKPTTNDLIRIINNGYADYLKNQVDWEHNDTRDLILKMKIALEQLTAERDEARREICESIQMIDPNDECWTRLNPQQIAEHREWDCFKNAPVVKTLNGVVVSKGKAVPPKFDIDESDK
jgi:hypothetical protein